MLSKHASLYPKAVSHSINWCFFARARREGVRVGLKEESCHGLTQCCEAKEWIAQAPRIYMLFVQRNIRLEVKKTSAFLAQQKN